MSTFFIAAVVIWVVVSMVESFCKNTSKALDELTVQAANARVQRDADALRQSALTAAYDILEVPPNIPCGYVYNINDSLAHVICFFNYNTPYFMVFDPRGSHKVLLNKIVSVDVQSDTVLVTGAEKSVSVTSQVEVRCFVKISTVDVDFSTIRIFTVNTDVADDIANQIRAIKFNYG